MAHMSGCWHGSTAQLEEVIQDFLLAFRAVHAKNDCEHRAGECDAVVHDSW